MSEHDEMPGRGEVWFATEHEWLQHKRRAREQRGDLPEVTIMCADGGRHREKRLGNGDASGCWPSRASKSWSSDDLGACRDVAGVYKSRDGSKTTTLDPCPECGRHPTLTHEKWQKVYAFCMLTGRTKFDVTLLPF